MVDYFVIEGNLGIARGVRFYIQNQKSRLEKLDQIKILDAGPAIGALTTLIVLQEFARAGLIDKVKVVLLDVSERVVERTQRRDFEFPDILIDKSFKSKIQTKLRLSKGIVHSVEQMPIKDESIDFTVAGFLFLNLHDDIKKAAAAELQRVTKPGGFIGIAGEWYEDHSDYQDLHKHDEIPLAYESLISYRKCRGLFKQTEIFDAHNPKKNDNFYYFCGFKKAVLGSGPREVGQGY
jgi:ubiquinone/menaquinone biosynthesis C-methylase UbiE